MLLRTHRAMAILLGTALSACGGPVVYHLDGRDLGPDFRIAPVERGWIAVDSCAVGLHAVVELEVDSLHLDAVPGTLTAVSRMLDTWSGAPERVQVDGPYCAAVPGGGRDGLPGAMSPAETRERFCAPRYIVRAQYVLRSLPRGDRTVVLHHLGRRIAVRWGY